MYPTRSSGEMSVRVDGGKDGEFIVRACLVRRGGVSEVDQGHRR